MNSVLLGCSYGSGIAAATDTSCAVGPGDVIVEVHESGGKLYYASGVVTGVAIAWTVQNGYINSSGKTSANSGKNPQVVVDNGRNVLEVHASGGVSSDLWYWTGTVASDGSSVSWTTNQKFPKSSGGHTPSIALNKNGVVVELHVNNTIVPPIDQSMYYWVGTFSGGSVEWLANASLDDSGYLPMVALNNNNVVVQVHSNGGSTLYYQLGKVTFGSDGKPDGISWTSSSTEYDKGDAPSVFITDDNYVYETHQAQLGAGSLWQRIGQIQFDSNGDPTSITWLNFLGQTSDDDAVVSYQYGYGFVPRIASNAVMVGGDSTNALAIHTHLAQIVNPAPTPPTFEVTGTASRVFDRGNWIGDNFTALSDLQLKQLVIPGSHDAGMYVHGVAANFAKTQDLDIYGQLLAGVRWFDLRPELDGDTWYINHNGIKGPLLSDVLSDIQTFLGLGGRELVILKYSHYKPDDFTQADLDSLCTYTSGYLDDWLYKGTVTRLGTTTVGELTGDQGTALVVCDGTPTVLIDTTANPGFWNYRDWNSSDPNNGNLTMFDVYSDTASLTTMISSLKQDTHITAVSLPRGQQPKFEGGTVSNPPVTPADWGGFAGVCMSPNTDVACDLFLLSWTLTPEPNSVWSGAEQADACLAQDVATKGPNRNGQQINVLYTDYVEYSRSADVAYVLNGLLG